MGGRPPQFSLVGGRQSGGGASPNGRGLGLDIRPQICHHLSDMNQAYLLGPVYRTRGMGICHRIRTVYRTLRTPVGWSTMGGCSLHAFSLPR